MATKRVPLHRKRLGGAAEVEAWSETFTTGYDFFGDLEDWGIEHRRLSRDEFEALAEEAWSRLGHMFMARWQPTDVREQPWAWEAFGEPGGN